MPNNKYYCHLFILSIDSMKYIYSKFYHYNCNGEDLNKKYSLLFLLSEDKKVYNIGKLIFINRKPHSGILNNNTYNSINIIATVDINKPNNNKKNK